MKRQEIFSRIETDKDGEGIYLGYQFADSDGHIRWLWWESESWQDEKMVLSESEGGRRLFLHSYQCAVLSSMLRQRDTRQGREKGPAMGVYSYDVSG